MKKSEILQIIREEIEVVLTNEEAIEFFDLDAEALLNEMMGEQEELDVRKLGRGPEGRETASATKRRLRGQAKTGHGKEVTPQEAGILKQVTDVLQQVAKNDNLAKYRSVLVPLLKKLQARTQGAGDKLNEEDDDWIGKAVDPEHEGDCTPMTKSTCTPPRKALAKRFKKAARKKKKEGGSGWQGKV